MKKGGSYVATLFSTEMLIHYYKYCLPIKRNLDMNRMTYLSILSTCVFPLYSRSDYFRADIPVI